jgi:arginyl-tRNA synthetase
MNVEVQLKKRFEAVVSEMIKPPVLFGPKWLQPGPGQGQFQFVGTLRIAKATGRNAQRIAKGLLKHLNLSDLRLKARVSPTGVITLSPAKPKEAKKAPASKGQDGSQTTKSK